MADQGSNDVNLVKVDVRVLLKIQKSANDSSAKEFPSGQLFGIYNRAEQTVEVTNCVLVPTEGEVDQEKEDRQVTNYFEEINYDKMKVGWFQISSSHEHVLSLMVHLNYQKEVPYAIFFVYDLSEIRKGSVTPFKAYRLGDKMDELARTYSKAELIEKFTSLNLSYDKIFVEVPVEITQSPLTKALFSEFHESIDSQLSQQHAYALPDFFERNIQYLVETIDENIDCEKKLVDNYSKAELPMESLQESIYDYLASYSRLAELNNKVKNYGKYQLDSSAVLEDLLKGRK